MHGGAVSLGCSGARILVTDDSCNSTTRVTRDDRINVPKTWIHSSRCRRLRFKKNLIHKGTLLTNENYVLRFKKIQVF